MVDGKDRDKAAKKAHEREPEDDKPKGPKKEPGKKQQSTDSTTVQVDKEEMERADLILAQLEESKGAVIRMLRINRGSILRMAVAEGLTLLEKRAEEGTLL